MLIRQGQKIWRSLRYVADMDPYNLVEFLMLLLAIPLTGMAWLLNLSWEYWMAGLALGLGAAASYFVRESLLVHPRNPARQCLGWLAIACFSFAMVLLFHQLT